MRLAFIPALTAVSTALSVGAAGSAAAAQAAASSGVPAHEEAIRAVRDSQRVRLFTSALARQEGRLLSYENDTLRLDRGADSLVHIWSMDVDSLWVRGSAWKAGAVVGSVLGAAFGVAYGLAMSEFGCECGHPSPGAGVAGGAVVGAAGALVGGLIGSVIPKWRLRFPR
jgi:hypothetical protein